MATRPVLQVIIGSTRPGRVGPSIAKWFAQVAEAQGDFAVELVDLKDVNLPLFDEPGHPMLGVYEHEHTKKWSTTVARADAFVFVIPEYNHSFNAAVKNAIDFLHHEWANKPVGFVTYGGVSAGVRGMQALKPTLAALKMVAVPEAVCIPNFGQYLNDNGEFEGPEGLAGAANGMLSAMHGWIAPLALRRS